MVIHTPWSAVYNSRQDKATYVPQKKNSNAGMKFLSILVLYVFMYIVLFVGVSGEYCSTIKKK